MKINNLTDKEIEEIGEVLVTIYCEECDYGVNLEKHKDAVHKINMHGGYYMFDGEGGCITKCPLCGKDSLIPEIE